MIAPTLATPAVALDDAALRDLLLDARTIAVVGWSDKEDRSSHGIAQYLHGQGFDVPLVNPRLAGKPGPFGEPVYRTLADIPRHVDIVDLFRNAAYVPGHTREAIAIGAGAVWAQSGIVSPEARAIAAEHGLPYIEDVCIAVAHLRLVRAPR